MCDLTIYATACHLDRSAAKWRDPCNAVAPEIDPGSARTTNDRVITPFLAPTSRDTQSARPRLRFATALRRFAPTIPTRHFFRPSSPPQRLPSAIAGGIIHVEVEASFEYLDLYHDVVKRRQLYPNCQREADTNPQEFRLRGDDQHVRPAPGSSCPQCGRPSTRGPTRSTAGFSGRKITITSTTNQKIAKVIIAPSTDERRIIPVN